MAKYIDADKVIEVIVNTPSMVGSKYDFDHDVLTALVDREHEIIDLINNNVPTSDVVPALHAHWINVTQVRNECSNCHGVNVGIYSKTLYCPHCGAKMDEG